jgi:hypothetical protein
MPGRGRGHRSSRSFLAPLLVAAAACGEAAATAPFTQSGSGSGGSASGSGGSSSGAGGTSSGGSGGGGNGSTSSGGSASSGSGSGSGSSGGSGGGSTTSSGSGGGNPGDDGGLSDATLPPWDGSFGDSGCADDPTAGFTEYMDTFKVQYPYNLMQSDRFSFVNGVYTAWVYPTDMPFKMGSPTGPRTEMRWSQNWSTGEREWEADVLVDSPTTHSCIMQVKSDSPSAEALYLQVDNGHLQNSVGPVIAQNVMDHWFHLNVAYDTATGTGRVWMNNCLIFTTTYKATQTWYFKNGVYGCDPMICRSHFQNIRFWQR